MAVRTHFPQDFSTGIQSNVMDGLENHQLKHGFMNALLFNHCKVKDLTFASKPQCELTVKGSGLKRRNIEESTLIDLTMPPIHFGGYDSNVIGVVVDPLVSTDRMRVVDSVENSMNGPSSCAPASQDLPAAYLHNQSLEIDAMIRLQNERLRVGLEQAQKRHCRSLISLLEQQFVRKLKEKDAELEKAFRKNAELEDKVQQMSIENQIWYNFAKNNEAIVTNLKASLEHVLLQSATIDNQAKEGYGDSDGTTDDVRSCPFFEEGEVEETSGAVEIVTAKAGQGASPANSCKMCREKEVGLLLLPCRHLCLCVDCGSKADTCPVCHVGKNVSLQVFMT